MSKNLLTWPEWVEERRRRGRETRKSLILLAIATVGSALAVALLGGVG